MILFEGRKDRSENNIGEGRGLVDCSLMKHPPPPPSNFIDGRPNAALLFWFSGDFRCGALLFMVILVIYQYKNR